MKSVQMYQYYLIKILTDNIFVSQNTEKTQSE